MLFIQQDREYNYYTYLYMGIMGLKLSEALKIFYQRLKLFLASFRYTFVVLKASPEMLTDLSPIANL